MIMPRGTPIGARHYGIPLSGNKTGRAMGGKMAKASGRRHKRGRRGRRY